MFQLSTSASLNVRVVLKNRAELNGQLSGDIATMNERQCLKLELVDMNPLSWAEIPYTEIGVVFSY